MEPTAGAGCAVAGRGGGAGQAAAPMPAAVPSDDQVLHGTGFDIAAPAEGRDAAVQAEAAAWIDGGARHGADVHVAAPANARGVGSDGVSAMAWMADQLCGSILNKAVDARPAAALLDPEAWLDGPWYDALDGFLDNNVQDGMGLDVDASGATGDKEAGAAPEASYGALDGFLDRNVQDGMGLDVDASGATGDKEAGAAPEALYGALDGFLDRNVQDGMGLDVDASGATGDKAVSAAPEAWYDALDGFLDNNVQDGMGLDVDASGATEDKAVSAAPEAWYGALDGLLDNNVQDGTGLDVDASGATEDKAVSAAPEAWCGDEHVFRTGENVHEHMVGTDGRDAKPVPPHAPAPQQGPLMVRIHGNTAAHPAVLLVGETPTPSPPIQEAAKETAQIVCRVKEAALFKDLAVWSSDDAVNAATCAVEWYVMRYIGGPLVLQGKASADFLGPLLKQIRLRIGRQYASRQGSSTRHTATDMERIVHNQATHVLLEFVRQILGEGLVTPSCALGDDDLQHAMKKARAHVIHLVRSRHGATSKFRRDAKTLLDRAKTIYFLSGWKVDHDVRGEEGDAVDLWMARLVKHGVTIEDTDHYAEHVFGRYASILDALLLEQPHAAESPRNLMAAVRTIACESGANARTHVKSVRELLELEKRNKLSATITNWTRKKVEVDAEALRLGLDGLFSPAGGNLVRFFSPTPVYHPTMPA